MAAEVQFVSNDPWQPVLSIELGATVSAEADE